MAVEKGHGSSLYCFMMKESSLSGFISGSREVDVVALHAMRY